MYVIYCQSIKFDFDKKNMKYIFETNKSYINKLNFEELLK